MLWRLKSLVWMLTLSLLLIGCGRQQSQRVAPPSPVDDLKTALQQVVQTGEVGSSAMLIKEKIEALKATDAAKADALARDAAELEKLDGKPQQAKAKAQEMLNKLGS